MRRSLKILPALLMLSILMIVSGALLSPNAGEGAGEDDTSRHYPAAQQVQRPTATEAANVVLPQPKVTATTVASSPWRNYPNVCETFRIIQSIEPVYNKRKKDQVYPRAYKRNRYQRGRRTQRRTRDLIRMVAEEMGADGEFLDYIARHETTWNSEAIHILNRDLKANKDAYELYSYSPSRESQIRAEMLKYSPKDEKKYYYWRDRLALMQVYKENPHWGDELEVDFIYPEHRGKDESTGDAVVIPEERLKQRHSVWKFGYGLYGMNAVLFMRRWDPQAPPWVLCADEGVIATIMAVWALRDAQHECVRLTEKDPERWGTDGGSYRGLTRRFGRGMCGKQRLGRVWQDLMVKYGKKTPGAEKGIDFDSWARLGTKWPQWKMKKKKGKWKYVYETVIDPETGKKRCKRNPISKRCVRIPTDRKELLTHMLEKAERKGLLRPEPLQRKDPDTKPIIVARGDGIPVN